MALFDDASLVVTPNGYKAGTLYSIKPTSGAGDMTVVRATTATRVNSAGLIESVANNVPRLDYSNGTCPSILIEPQRTNVVLYSQQFDDASWLKLGTALTVTANTTISPDGTQNADTLNVSNNDNVLYSFATGTFAGNSFTFTIYAKGTGTFGMNIRLNLSTTTTQTKTLTSQWQRFEVTVTNASPVTTIEFYLNLNTSSTYNIWGAQTEAGSYPTSYIPTTSAAVTRNADAIYKTGISALIGQTEGVVFFDAINLFTSGTRTLALLYTSGSAFYQIYLNSSNQVRVDVNGSFIFAGGTITSNTQFKIAFAYKSGDNALYINGTQIATSASTTIPSSLNDYYLGNSIGSEQSGSYGQATLFPTRLTNAELSQLTTI